MSSQYERWPGERDDGGLVERAEALDEVEPIQDLESAEDALELEHEGEEAVDEEDVLDEDEERDEDEDGKPDELEDEEEEEDEEGDVEAEADESPEAEAFPEVDIPEDTDPSMEAIPLLRVDSHAPGDLALPDGVSVLEGSPLGGRRGVAIVASRFNGEITNSLIESAMAELERAGVLREAVTIMPVPGAFELPLGAMALAKTRRFSCVIALGCIIRGETAHFDYVAGEASSGLQLAALETGVPVSFGVLTVENIEQARARIDKGAEAARAALEMADVFSQLRTAASR
jgi:6,7-dimethyl-8-ribityllumazine synthase